MGERAPAGEQRAEAGRPLRPYFLNDCTLGRDEVLLMSDYSPAIIRRPLLWTIETDEYSIGDSADYNMEIKRMSDSQNEGRRTNNRGED
jgi:hypothetical protein